MPFIYVNVHLKTILAVTLFSTGVPEVHVSEDGVLLQDLSSCEV